jgi:gluconate 2-dehydrogenase gamma chain
MPRPSDDVIDRREALRRTALLLGGALSAPAIAGVLAGCEARRGSGGAWTPRALTTDQGELVATIADHILPETDTPGARGAGVHRFIDTMLAEYYPTEERHRFLAGLADVDARARRDCGRAFLRCGAEGQRAVLDRLDREAFTAPVPRPVPDPAKETERGAADTKAPAEPKSESVQRPAPGRREVPFFRTMKELTLLGYYTSEIGATRELHHVQVPGRFEGCVPLTQVGRTWAV